MPALRRFIEAIARYITLRFIKIKMWSLFGLENGGKKAIVLQSTPINDPF